MGREDQEVEERIRKIKKNVAAFKAAEMAQLSYVMVTLFCLIISWAHLTSTQPLWVPLGFVSGSRYVLGSLALANYAILILIHGFAESHRPRKKAP